MFQFNASITEHDIKRLIDTNRNFRSKTIEIVLFVFSALTFAFLLYALGILASSAHYFFIEADGSLKEKIYTLNLIEYFWIKVAFVLGVGVPITIFSTWLCYASGRALIDNGYLAKRVYNKNKEKLANLTYQISDKGIQSSSSTQEEEFYAWEEFKRFTKEGLLYFLIKDGKEPFLLLPLDKMENEADQLAIVKLIKQKIA